jgi:hypothetical protein
MRQLLASSRVAAGDGGGALCLSFAAELTNRRSASEAACVFCTFCVVSV